MQLGIIYLATAPSGKRYVGQTRRTLAQRISQHRVNSRAPRTPFAAAIAKYGDAIQWRTLAVVGVDFLNDTERFYIADFREREIPLYNVTAGGLGNNSPRPTIRGANNPMNRPEVRAKNSAAKKGRKLSPEHIANVVAKTKGKKRSAEFCARQSARLTGKPSPCKGQTRAPLSPAHRAAISATKKRNSGMPL